MVAKPDIAAAFLGIPVFSLLKAHVPSSLFIIEAELFNPDYVHQAVCEMYACGKLLQKQVVRGVLTNGHDWVFLLIKPNISYDGASYKQSAVIQLQTTENHDGQLVIPGPWPDLIAAILLHWIQNGSADLGSDDWFELAHTT